MVQRSGSQVQYTLAQSLRRTSRREKLMEISFFGLSERCQYWQVAAGMGSTTPAVYAACQMPSRLTRLVISCVRSSSLVSAGSWVS